VANNTLYYGDNLEILPRYVADESVGLIFLHAQFNSNASYDLLFAEATMSAARTGARV
jgi:hypothetical protein